MLVSAICPGEAGVLALEADYLLAEKLTLPVRKGTHEEEVL